MKVYLHQSCISPVYFLIKIQHVSSSFMNDDDDDSHCISSTILSVLHSELIEN